MVETSKSEAKYFIEEVKDILDQEEKLEKELKDKGEKLKASNRLLIINKRKKKNKDYIRRKGFTREDIRTYLQTLTAENYSQGPKDDDRMGFDFIWWVYGRMIDDEPIYIKLRKTDTDPKRVYCDSFHVQDYELHFPFKSNWGRRG